MPETALLQMFFDKINNNSMTLPTLPDIAIKVMEVTDRQEVNAQLLVSVLMRDSALSLRLIRLANSAHFNRRVPVETVHQAVVRIGFTQVKALVVAMAMEQLFISADPYISKILKSVWDDSVRITAYAIALSQVRKNTKIFEPLMLLGVTSRIGMLAILCEMEKSFNRSMFKDLDLSNLQVIEKSVTLKIFETWDFPEELRTAVTNYFQGNEVGIAEYVIFSSLYGGKPSADYTSQRYVAPDKLPELEKIAAEVKAIFA
jgi:HD-like signal output (HDOD) protein